MGTQVCGSDLAVSSLDHPRARWWLLPLGKLCRDAWKHLKTRGLFLEEKSFICCWWMQDLDWISVAKQKVPLAGKATQGWVLSPIPGCEQEEICLGNWEGTMRSFHFIIRFWKSEFVTHHLLSSDWWFGVVPALKMLLSLLLKTFNFYSMTTKLRGERKEEKKGGSTMLEETNIYIYISKMRPFYCIKIIPVLPGSHPLSAAHVKWATAGCISACIFHPMRDD